MNEGVKIYGLCLERLKHQIGRAKERAASPSLVPHASRFILESYCTDDYGELIDILELYDVGEGSAGQVREKLDELAYTVSVLTREAVHFAPDAEGVWGIYVTLRKSDAPLPEQANVAASAAVAA